jgi:hypothetical protein
MPSIICSPSDELVGNVVELSLGIKLVFFEKEDTFIKLGFEFSLGALTVFNAITASIVFLSKKFSASH